MASPLTGTRWGMTSQGQSGGAVTWSFAKSAGSIISFDATIQIPAFRDAVRLAFDLWESVANIDFNEIADLTESNIRLGWDALDGKGGTLAEAHWQYSGSRTSHGEIAFDTAEQWSAPASSGADFFAVAVHEIGHVIGLAHSDAPTSIMYAYLIGNYAGLSAADIQAVQQLYGASLLSGQVLVGTSLSETLSGGSGNDTVSGGTGSDTLIGGSGADIIRSTTLAGEAVTVFGGATASDPADGSDQILISGSGSADIYGNGGADRIVFTGAGTGRIFGGLGDDQIEIVNHANNIVSGGTIDGDVITVTGNGNNVVFGGSSTSDAADGSDRISILGNGANTVYANAGDDIVSVTGTGRNTIYGGLGDDKIQMGAGADRIIAGPGINVLTGGGSGDVFVYSRGSSDIITDFRFSEGDRLDLQGQSYTVGTVSDGSAAYFFDGGVIILHGVTAADFSSAYLVS